jgi:hypothetical protein
VKKGFSEMLRTLRFWQTVFGLGAVGLVALAATWPWWPFNSDSQKLSPDPSIWQFLLSDQVTLGFIRAGIAALVLYLAISIPALVAGGRWMRAFGTSGLTADEAQSTRRTVADLEAKLDDVTKNLNESLSEADRLRKERNSLRELVVEMTTRATQSQTRAIRSPMIREPRSEDDEHGRTEGDQEEAGGDRPPGEGN